MDAYGGRGASNRSRRFEEAHVLPHSIRSSGTSASSSVGREVGLFRSFALSTFELTVLCSTSLRVGKLFGALGVNLSNAEEWLYNFANYE